MRHYSIDERIEKANRPGALASLKTVNQPGFDKKVKAKTEKERLEKLKKQKELQTHLQTHSRNLKAKK